MEHECFIQTLPKAKRTQRLSALDKVSAYMRYKQAKNKLSSDEKYWKLKVNVEKLLSSCCQAVSCHQPIVNTLFTVSISKSDNINKFLVDIFNS